MIRNYTSSISAEKSISRIEAMLVANGVEKVLKVYNKEDKSLDGLIFELQMVNSTNIIPIKLPAKIQQIEKLLLSQVKRHTDTVRCNVKEQAQRTAWKLLAEWVEINIELVKLQQIHLLEVFLPYSYDYTTKTSFYNHVVKSGFKAFALPAYHQTKTEEKYINL